MKNKMKTNTFVWVIGRYTLVCITNDNKHFCSTFIFVVVSTQKPDSTFFIELKNELGKNITFTAISGSLYLVVKAFYLIYRYR